MTKTKICYVCQECGYDTVKWLGQCPECGAWNSLVEEKVRQASASHHKHVVFGAKPCPVTEIDATVASRMSTQITELDRVLGGGIVPGSLILLGGDPGIGKSTMVLEMADKVASSYRKVLYVSGEESAAQTKMRAQRLDIENGLLYIMTETDLDEVLKTAKEENPCLLIIDSIQTMYCQEIPSAPGSVGQVREATGKLLRFAKDQGVAVVIIGHVTKEGNIAGPRLLEHMVDVVLYFEGERNYAVRILRAMKNRFGSTHESGIFSMEEGGLKEVANPSAMLLLERPKGTEGSIVHVFLEGSRPLLIEIQALVSTTCFGMPRRMAAGFDYNKIVLLVAVLEKRVGLLLSNQDVYVNAVGGIRLNEPAADLAVALAIASSYKSTIVNPNTVVMGEVGLTGEVRMIAQVERRIQDASALGFKRFVIPAANQKNLKLQRKDLEIIGVHTVTEAMGAVFL